MNYKTKCIIYKKRNILIFNLKYILIKIIIIKINKIYSST